MKLRTKLLTCASTWALLVASVPLLHAQDPAKGGQETTITGCLNKGSGQSQYMFSDQRSGQQMEVTGGAELANHVNHTVRLTGTESNEAGKAVFHATKVEHIAATCQASSEKGQAPSERK